MIFFSDLFEWRDALLVIGAICLNAVPGCILWKRPTILKRDYYRGQNSAQMTEYETRMQVETDISNVTVTIQKTDQTDRQVSNTTFIERLPVLKGEIGTKRVVVTEGENKRENRCNIGGIIGMHIMSILCNRCFILVVFGTMFGVSSAMTILIFVSDMYQENGLSSDDVSLGLFLVNIFGIFGRLLLGFAVQSKFVSTLFVPLFCSLVSAVLFLLFPFIKARSLILALTAFFGVFIGMYTSMYSILTVKLMDSNLLPIAMGIFYTMSGIGNLVIGPLNGKNRKCLNI